MSGEIYVRVILRFIVVERINFFVGVKLCGDRVIWLRCIRLIFFGYFFFENILICFIELISWLFDRIINCGRSGFLIV